MVLGSSTLNLSVTEDTYIFYHQWLPIKSFFRPHFRPVENQQLTPVHASAAAAFLEELMLLTVASATLISLRYAGTKVLSSLQLRRSFFVYD